MPRPALRPHRVSAASPVSRPRALERRFAAAFVLIPIVLAALWFGSPYWDLLIAAAGAAMSWEWSRLTGGGFGRPGWLAMLAVLASLAAERLVGPVAAIASLAIGAGLVATVVIAAGTTRRALWLAAGVAYVGLPSLAMLWLQQEPGLGFATVLWLLVLVWAIDSAAYAVGKAIGGPKLIPRVSPNKTWAGLIGGAAAAAIVGYVAARWQGQTDPWLLAGLSALLAVVEQAGDAVESAVKRHFGVKDSSGLIPGHGGMLDRVDGLVAISLAVAGFELIVGRSPLAL